MTSRKRRQGFKRTNRNNNRTNSNRTNRDNHKHNGNTFHKTPNFKNNEHTFLIKNNIWKKISIISLSLVILLQFLDEYSNDFLTLILLLVFVVASYKSWIWKYPSIRRHKQLVTHFTYACILLLLTGIIPIDSSVGYLIDLATTILLCYITIAFTWIMLIYINNLNLANDLNCWGVRILGFIFIIFGVIIMSVNMIGTMLIQNQTTTPYIITVLGLCLIILGIFSQFRANRRYGTFVYLR